MAAKKAVAKKAVKKVVEAVKAPAHSVAEVWGGSHMARSYTKEKHGAKFADLAEQFVEKQGGNYRVVLK